MLTADMLRRDVDPLRLKDLQDDIAGWPSVEPATVLMALNDAAFHADVGSQEAVESKYLAVQTCLISERPYIDPEAFDYTVCALNGRVPNVGYFPTMPMPAEVAYAAQVMERLAPTVEFGISVKRYARELLRFYGVAVYPKSWSKLKLTAEECATKDCAIDSTIEGDSEMARVQREKLKDIEDYVSEKLGAEPSPENSSAA